MCKKYFLIILLALCIPSVVFANEFHMPQTAKLDVAEKYPMYVGPIFGYGTTTWRQIVGRDDLSRLSTPVNVEEGGFTYGLLIGYNLSTWFALEASYVRIPTATIYLDPESSDDYPIKQFNNRTNLYTIVGKFIVPISDTNVGAFADAGMGIVQRSDFYANVSRITGAFGFGFMVNPVQHLLVQVGFRLYMGYGRSEALPVKDFVPFVYTVHMAVAYRFGV